MKTKWLLAISCVALSWAFFLIKSPQAHAHRDGCDLRIRGRLNENDTIVLIRGATGAAVTLTDYDTEAALGSGVLSGEDVCDGSAEITLSTPLVGAQVVLARDDLGGSATKWVWPPVDPSIAIYPFCDNAGVFDGMLYGFDWQPDAPIDIFWEGSLVQNVTPNAPFFETSLLKNNLAHGVYEIQATQGGFTSTTLFEVPCPSFGNEAVVKGTVYIESDGVWQPASHAPIVWTVEDTSFVESSETRRNGRYRIETNYGDSHTVASCVVRNGVAYADQVTTVVAPASDVDLFLQPTNSAECTLAGIEPVEPPDLVIGTPQVQVIDEHHWIVSTTISNTSSVTISQSFYVDAWTPRGHGYGYVSVPGLAANSSLSVTIQLEAYYPISNQQTVVVMVDGGHDIDEYDESNNHANNQITPRNDIETVAVYLLAFDNPSYSAGNLTPQLPETLKGIEAATKADRHKLAIVLADLDQDGDTHVMAVYNGQTEYINGLPNHAGLLDESIREYDMSDGATLGGFLLWARTQFPAEKQSLFVYAHGAPLAPETDLTAVFGSTTAARTPIPLPSWVTAHPDLTDYHPIGLLTPHDLQVALDVATNSGADQYAVVDLVHCFSLSIEEVYEVAPYAEVIAGSPNYAYFDASLPGGALEVLDGELDSLAAADSILAKYDALLPSEGYPRLMMAVDTSQLEAIKQSWDVVSAELLTAFDTDHTNTRSKIETAYLNSAKYDTTYCEPDWTLAPPDALSDMHDFALQLEQAFLPDSGVGLASRDAANALASAVTSRYETDGVPHFTEGQVAPHWDFTGLGIALYTDLGGVAASGGTQLSWHADFYTSTVSAENPHPYRFISDANSWADVFARYWQGIDTTTHGCVATFPPVRDSGELTIAKLLNPDIGEAALNTPLQPSIQLQVVGELGNAIVQFAIEQNGTLVFSDTVGSGRVFTGTHWVSTNSAWTPTALDTYTLTVTVDPENYVDEQNEADNVLTFVDGVSAENGSNIKPNAALANDQQWLTDLTAPLTLLDGRMADIDLEIVSYQFSINGSVASPFERGSNSVTTAAGTVQVPLGSGFSPGAVQLHVWEVVGGERSQLPTALRLNYIPANTPISADEMHCFPFALAVDDQVQIRLNTPANGDANLFIWYPHSYDTPDLVGTRIGDDDLLIESAPTGGDYLLCVRGVNGTTYTLSVVENGDTLFTHPTSPENDPNATIPASRILYEDPSPANRSITSAVSLSERPSASSPMTLLLGSMLLFVMTAVLVYRAGVWPRHR